MHGCSQFYIHSSRLETFTLSMGMKQPDNMKAVYDSMKKPFTLTL